MEDGEMQSSQPLTQVDEVAHTQESADPALADPRGDEEEEDDDDAADPNDAKAALESPSAETPSSESGAKPAPPLQKRRRVTRACDECRRKKIKCDGKQPCTHCTVYSYECTYDQPSNRRRNPAPQYIEALEQRLQKAESILRTVLPGLDLDDPKFDARSVEQLLEHSHAKPTAPLKQSATADGPKPEDDAQLQSMVDQTGSLDLDDYGNWDFHGHSSGYVFMRKFRAQFGDKFLAPEHLPKNRVITQMLESPKSSSPYDANLVSHIDLPPREVAVELCRNTIDDSCALMRPLHRPSFFRRLHAIYDTDPEHYNNDHVQFLPLLYVVMAVGCLFSKTENENSTLDLKGYREATEQGYAYFSTAKQMLDITDCRDLVTIQTITFMIMFLQSSAKLPICYAYIGIAIRACCRLGLHRQLPTKFNPVEQEERKRIFWLVRKLDTYVGAVLGLPQMLSDEDVDQELPLEVDDECITETGIQSMPAGQFALMRATNAHTRLVDILRKVVRFIYPLKGLDAGRTDRRYTISHKRIRELERDLQHWMDQLPMELRPSENTNNELTRVQQLLRISYAHVQMMLYRPFIHYVSQSCQARQVDKRSFACAAACISVARNIVHITSEMKRRGLLVGAYWFVMYTTYFSILSLVFFVIENPNSPTGKDILKDAVEGRDTLADLAKRSMAADRCTGSLMGLFDVLPEKLKERRSSLSSAPTPSRKRPAKIETAGNGHEAHRTQSVATPTGMRESASTPARARSIPSDYLAKLAKRNSMSDPALSMCPEAAHVAHPASMSYQSPVTSSPISPGFEFTPQMSHVHIPDLKNVMFPGDNPFAYPNPPTSALDSLDGGFIFPDAGLGSNEASIFGTPSSGHVQMTPIPPSQMGYDFGFQHIVNDQPLPHPGLHAQQFGGPGHASDHDGQFNPAYTEILMQHAIGGDNLNLGAIPDLRDSTNAPDGPGASAQPDAYWNSLGKAQMGTESLDDYFSGEVWNPTWADHHFSNGP